MGREKIFEKIKKQASKMIKGSIVLLVLGILATLFCLIAFEGEDLLFILFVSPLTVIGLILLICGIVRKSHPEKSNCFKKNPKLLEMADELFSNVVYEDNFIIASHKVLANKKDITQMVNTNEVVWIYEYTQSYNFVSTTHDLLVRTYDYTMRVSVYSKGQQTIIELIDKICNLCPNARVGYSDENFEYFNQRQQFTGYN